MSTSHDAQKFVDAMIKALRSAETLRPSSRQFLDKLIAEMQNATLTRNPLPPGGKVPSNEWKLVVDLTRQQRNDKLIDAILDLVPIFAWLPQDSFWTEPEHKAFAERMWGAFAIGQEDASFSADDRYIALVTMVEPQTLYPLHQHRIEEAYYVVGGEAEWSHDGREWVTLRSGGVFFNQSHEPHAIRTNEKPLLFVSFYLPPFGWEGGMVQEEDV